MSDPRRACFIRQGYYPQDPRVLKQVTALQDAGWEIDVVCMRRTGQRKSEVVDGVGVHRVNVTERHAGALAQAVEYLNFFLRAAVRTTLLDGRRKFDVVQIHNMPDPLVFAALVPKLRGARVILDMHELMPEFFAARYATGAQKAWLRIIRMTERLSLRFADRVMAQNGTQRATLRARTGVETPLLHNVPIERYFRPPDEPVAATADVFTHGTIAERYGIGTFVDAIVQLAGRREISAVVVGDGEDLTRFREEAGRKAPGRIEFTGRVPFESVPDRISAARVCVVPLQPDGYMETISPNKMFEYVALGRPVVAADTPGMREYFDDRSMAFFRPGDPRDLTDKIEALLDDSSRCAAMTSAATAAYERVRWDVTKLEYVEGVGSLVASRRRRGR